MRLSEEGRRQITGAEQRRKQRRVQGQQVMNSAYRHASRPGFEGQLGGNFMAPAAFWGRAVRCRPAAAASVCCAEAAPLPLILPAHPARLGRGRAPAGPPPPPVTRPCCRPAAPLSPPPPRRPAARAAVGCSEWGSACGAWGRAPPCGAGSRPGGGRRGPASRVTAAASSQLSGQTGPPRQVSCCAQHGCEPADIPRMHR
jgi:hypothetical protein